MSVSKSVGVIQLGIIHIKDDNVKGLGQVLNALPLANLGNQADSLLSLYLSVCATYGRSKSVKIILGAWNVIYPKEEKIQILSKLFMMNNINLPTLSFVILSHDDYTYIEAMDDLMLADNSPEVITACGKADEIFGPQPYETYKIIREHAFEMGNYKVEEYAIANMEETAPYAPIPKWVKNYTDKPLVKEDEMEIPKIGDIPFIVPPDEEAVEILTKGLTQNGISAGDLDQAREFLLEKLSTSTRQEKINILKPVMENQANQILSGDKVLFRIFGPANPLVNQDLTLNTPSSKYGGCRMFLCDIFDFDEEFNVVLDWFRGVCDECHLRIRQRWHAVRRPRPHGGWEDAFCSWKCVRESLVPDDRENLLARELINIFEKKINETGIQDRLSK